MYGAEKDTGWAWIIAAACCVGNFLTLGFSYSTGIYYIIFLEAFDEKASRVAWIPSINLGTLCMIGPLMSISITKVGPRLTMFAGSVIVSVGLASAAFATNLYELYITFGVIAGAGIGFVYLTACAVIPMYFEKYRSGVLGVVIAASAVGNFVYPFIIPALAEQFGWRGSLLICSAMCLQTCVASMFIPRKFTYNYKKNIGDKELYPDQMEKLKDANEDTHSMQGALSMVEVTKDLFCDFRFNILFALTGIYMTGASVIFTYLAGYAKAMGAKDFEADLLISIMGGFSLGGRVILGLLGHVRCINSVILLCFTYLLTGAGIIIAAVKPTFVGCVVCAATFGFSYAATGPVYFEVMCRLFDPKRFSFALGYGMLIIGVGLTIGGPLGGFAYEMTSFFPTAFYFAGALCIFSAVLCILLYIVSYLCNLRK